MKINLCGLTEEERITRRKERLQGKWLPYFAWAPVRVGANDCRWLEWVERRIGTVGPVFGSLLDVEYRAIRNAA